jgi:hypothetical protein
MFFVPVLLAVTPMIAPSVDRQPDTTGEPRCQIHQAMKTDSAAKPMTHSLGAEPPAQSLYAVVRAVDGCATPVVLMAEVGQPRVR